MPSAICEQTKTMIISPSVVQQLIITIQYFLDKALIKFWLPVSVVSCGHLFCLRILVAHVSFNIWCLVHRIKSTGWIGCEKESFNLLICLPNINISRYKIFDADVEIFSPGKVSLMQVYSIVSNMGANKGSCKEINLSFFKCMCMKLTCTLTPP